MKVRNAIAVGASLLLLCASSFASVCELSCSIGSSRPVTNATTAAEVVTPHSQCDGAGMHHQAPVAEHTCAPVTRCHEAPCGQASIYSSLLSARENATIEAAQFVMPVAIPSTGVHSELHIVKIGGPQLKILLRGPSSLPLRI